MVMIFSNWTYVIFFFINIANEPLLIVLSILTFEAKFLVYSIFTFKFPYIFS